MDSKLEKELIFLKRYVLVSSAVILTLIFMALKAPQQNQKFEEIDVERINIVEKDGQLKMVISNKARQHPGIVNGKVIVRDYPRPPGIIFFNQIGDEMGGLVYGENGPNGHFGSLTWDKFKGDQTIGFRHLEGENGTYESGIQMWQQPNIPGDVRMKKMDSVSLIDNETERKAAFQTLRDNNLLTTRRLFLGKSRSNASVLEMLDMKGKTKLALMVDEKGDPKLLFFDGEGNITLSIPEENK